MVKIGINLDLVKQLKQVARERSVETDVVVEEALKRYLRIMEREKMQKEIEMFRVMHDELQKLYSGQFVAIHHGEVVDVDADFLKLHIRIRQRFGRQPVLIRGVGETSERELVFRSPRRDNPAWPRARW